MKNIFSIWIIFLLPLALVAYEDSDMDGVADSVDKCPNTLITDLVDINGCTIKELVSPHHYDIVVGLSYSKLDETLKTTNTVSKSVQFDYYYKNLSLQVATSHYTSTTGSVSDSGLNDTLVAAYYQLNPSKDFSIRLGAGISLPTYDADNNNADYVLSTSMSYTIDTMNVFGGYSYTLVNDDDIVLSNLYYQNSSSYYAGLGFYPTSKLYISASYSSSQSVYDGDEDIDSASIYTYYAIGSKWFTSFNFGAGLSDSASDISAACRLGYYF